MTPDKYTNQELFLEVGDGHQLYVHDWGNKDAKKVIFFLHGGPGDGCRDRHKGQFDPTRQRVIFHDQRGSGRSLPTGSLENNTTDKAVEDISKLADKLGIKQFVITGGSWGSTLALAYALAHPERVEAMVLDGIFTATRSETEWIDKGQFRTFYPDVWEQFKSTVPKSHQGDPSAYHLKRVMEGDDQAQKEAGLAYETMEASVLSLDDRYTPSQLDDYDPSGIKIEMFYLAQGCFLPEGYILDTAHTLTMPIYLVQGRYDMVCPPVTAYELHKRLPNSELFFTTSGHKGERETWNVKRTLLQELTK